MNTVQRNLSYMNDDVRRERGGMRDPVLVRLAIGWAGWAACVVGLLLALLIDLAPRLVGPSRSYEAVRLAVELLALTGSASFLAGALVIRHRR